MKLKNLFVISIAAVTCFSLSAVVVKDSEDNTKLSVLEMGVDTVALGSCPLHIDNAIGEAADMLRKSRREGRYSYSVMRRYINTGKPQTHTGPLWNNFMKVLNSINYSKNMNQKCIEIIRTGERISAQDYLQAVVKDLN